MSDNLIEKILTVLAGEVGIDNAMVWDAFVEKVDSPRHEIESTCSLLQQRGFLYLDYVAEESFPILVILDERGLAYLQDTRNF